MSTTEAITMDLTSAPAPALWFEFLLDQEKLRQHLESNNCDPSPTQLINLFLRSAISDYTSNFQSPATQKPNKPLSDLLSELTNGESNGPQVNVGKTSNNDNKKYNNSCEINNGINTNNVKNEPGLDEDALANRFKCDDTSKSPEYQKKSLVTDNTPDVNDSFGSIPNFNDSLTGPYDKRISNNVPGESYEAEYSMKKYYGLQILAIKVASYLNWDLDTICNNLNLPIQLILMHSLLRTCQLSPDIPIKVKNFLAVTYSHWLIRSAMDNHLSSMQPQSQSTTIIYLSQYQQQQQTADNNVMNYLKELLAPKSRELDKWSNFLRKFIWDLNEKNSSTTTPTKRIKTSIHPLEKAKILRPTMECFDVDFQGKPPNWSECEPVNTKELLQAACYDLGRYYFFEESYDLSKGSFEIIKNSSAKFQNLSHYLETATKLLAINEKKTTTDLNDKGSMTTSETANSIAKTREKTEKYLFECMTQFRKLNSNNKETNSIPPDMIAQYYDLGEFNQDSDLRLNAPNTHLNSHHMQQSKQTTTKLLPQTTCDWYLQINPSIEPPHFMETNRGDLFMSKGNFKEAMACFTGALMLITDYFRKFSKNYQDEEPYISRMIQSSISLSCYTQAVALCQMSKNLNYTIAFKQLNERVCNDCCDDIYECIWNVTLLEYIINLHSRRGEVERRTKVIQLIGQLELNENNSDDILREAEHVRRGKFFRILANKYL